MATVPHRAPKSKPTNRFAEMLQRHQSPQNRLFMSIISQLEAARNAIAAFVASADRGVPFANSPTDDVCRDAEALSVFMSLFVEFHGGEQIQDPTKI